MKYFSAVIVFSTVLSACALTSEPFRTYSDANHPLSDTSVFSVYDDHVPDDRMQVGIVAIDGKPFSCAGAGCNFWVRVLPGNHEFEIRYNLMDGGLRSYKTATIKMAANMKAKKIYVARAVPETSSLQVKVEELADDYDYKLPLGLKGANQQNFRATF